MARCTILSALNFIFLSAVYGSAFAATNEGIKYFSPPMQQVFRMMFGFLISVVICIGRLIFQKGYIEIFKGHFKHGIMPFVHLTVGGFMNIGVSHCLIAIGQQWVSSSFLQVLQPFATAAGAISGHFLLPDEKITLIKIISLVLSFIGVALSSVPNFLNAESQNKKVELVALGFVLVIIAFCMFGIAPVYFKWTYPDADVTVSTLVQTFMSAIVCLIYALAFDGIEDVKTRTSNVPPIAYLWPFLTGSISSGLGTHLFMIMITQLGAFGANFIPFGQLIFGLGIGIGILHEWDGYTWWMIFLNIFGIVVLVVAMSLVFFTPSSKDKEIFENTEKDVDEKCDSAKIVKNDDDDEYSML